MDWMAYQLEDHDTSPYSDGWTYTAPTPPDFDVANVHFLPLASAESVAYNPNSLTSPTVQKTMAPMKTKSGAVVVAGTIPTVIPLDAWGAAGGGKLYDWIFNRRSEPYGAVAPYTDANQLSSATVWISVMNGDTRVVKKITGVKVGRCTIESGAGSAWVNMSLELVGRQMVKATDVDTDPTTTEILDNIYGTNTVVPEYCHLDSYLWEGTSHTLPADYTAAHLHFDPEMLSWTVGIDNKLVEDGYRLDGTGLIRRLYNADREVTGSFGRDFRNAGYFDRFLAGTEFSLVHQLVRDARHLVIECPRIKAESGGPFSGGDRGGYNQESYSWRALGVYGASLPANFSVGQELNIIEA